MKERSRDARFAGSKKTILGSCYGLIFLAMLAWAQTPPQAMSAGDAFQALKELNDKSALVPESLMGLKMKYNSLSPENCFGLVLSQGWRLTGESSGKNNYGISFQYSGDPSPTVQIGFLHSNSDFVISDKTIPAGAYAVLARPDLIQLTGNAGTYHLERNRQVPDARTEQIPLPNRLSAAQFEKKSPEGPRFNVVLEAGRPFVAIGENKLAIAKK